MHTYMLVCVISANSLQKSACSMHQVCIFFHMGVFLRKTPTSYADLMQNTCRLIADFCTLVRTFFWKSLRLADYADCAKVCMSAKIWHADFMHTFSLGCKVCIKSSTRSIKPSKNLAIQHDANAQNAYLLRPGRAPALPPPPPSCWPWWCCRQTMPGRWSSSPLSWQQSSSGSQWSSRRWCTAAPAQGTVSIIT